MFLDISILLFLQFLLKFCFVNSDFLIPISLHPNVVDLRYYNPWILLDLMMKVYKVQGLNYEVAKKIWVCMKTLIILWKLHITVVLKACNLVFVEFSEISKSIIVGYVTSVTSGTAESVEIWFNKWATWSVINKVIIT